MEEEILLEMKEYIEGCEVQMDGEWGMCRTLKQLIKDNAMPELYNKICKLLK